MLHFGGISVLIESITSGKAKLSMVFCIIYIYRKLEASQLIDHIVVSTLFVVICEGTSKRFYTIPCAQIKNIGMGFLCL